MPQSRLSDEEIRKIAKLARLEIPPDRVDTYREHLSAVLDYVERLRQVDLNGVEPLSHVHEGGNRLDDDVPGSTLPNEALMRMAPQSMPPFIQVPKVIDGGASA